MIEPEVHKIIILQYLASNCHTFLLITKEWLSLILLHINHIIQSGDIHIYDQIYLSSQRQKRWP